MNCIRTGFQPEQKNGNDFAKTILRETMKDYVPYRRAQIGVSPLIEEQLSKEKSDLYLYG